MAIGVPKKLGACQEIQILINNKIQTNTYRIFRKMNLLTAIRTSCASSPYVNHRELARKENRDK